MMTQVQKITVWDLFGGNRVEVELMIDYSATVVSINGTPAFKAEAFKGNCFMSPDHQFDFMSRKVRKLYLRTAR